MVICYSGKNGVILYLTEKCYSHFFKLLRVHEVQLQIQKYQNANDVFEEVGKQNTSLLFQVTQ